MQLNNNTRWTTSRGGAVMLLSALIILVLAVRVNTASALEVSKDRYDLSGHFEFFEDPLGALAIHHILQDPRQYAFESSVVYKPEAYYTPVWLRLRLEFDEAARGKEYVLVSGAENFADIRLYRPNSEGRYEEFITGNQYLASSRELASARYAFEIEPTDSESIVYLRYSGGVGTNEVPWHLVEKNLHIEGSQKYDLVEVASYAAMLALILFNVILAVAVRKAAYACYGAFMFSVFMAFVSYDGTGFYYLWPDLPQFNDSANHIFNLLSRVFRILAVMLFLNIALCAPRWHRAAIFVIGIEVATLLAISWFGTSQLPAYFATVPWLIGTVFGFALCIVGIVKRQPLAIPLFATLLVPTLALALQSSYWLSGGDAWLLAKQVGKIGFVFHAVLWSVCLAAQIKLQAETTRIALHDNLTGLPQAALLRERFEWAAGLAKRQQWRIAVLFIDLDGFKEVNDTLGHASGDRVLLEAAVRMRRALRKTDYVARLGGDEFVVLLIDVPTQNSISTATNRLLNSISQPISIDGETKVGVSASVGVSIYDGESRSFPQLLRDADAAMYAAKNKGKNTYTIDSQSVAAHGAEPHLTLVTQ
ncbi:MAG: diguanylate cyclase [Halioglobus sp.]